MDPQPDQERAASTPATERTPLLPQNGSRPPTRPVPRAVIAGHWVTALGGILAISLAVAVYAINQYNSPRVYHLIWTIQDNISPTLFAGILSASWAIGNLVRVRRVGVLMPALVAAIIHAGLAMFFVMTSIQAADTLLQVRPCRVYGDVGDDERFLRCEQWAAKFHILLWTYLASAFLLGCAHAVLFVSSCASPFRDPSWRRNLSTWRFPTGQLTVEFTVKFLRQEQPSGAAQNAAPAINEAAT
ncbi:uncharacterized protein B0H64DRAFT_402516 [Chaetomium fimeti]|uniref:Uncharacterized protein n=1 Tax=Chaetomium fimeti TaxID=1854472 RepID=A0AAE0LRS0_9PEZI|nr:hypothetical protein B0H64DRAFT_402516 [Chaetomium fimeti]